MKPLTSARNLTPTSIAEVSGSESVPGVVVELQTVHGQVAAAAVVGRSAAVPVPSRRANVAAITARKRIRTEHPPAAATTGSLRRTGLRRQGRRSPPKVPTGGPVPTQGPGKVHQQVM